MLALAHGVPPEAFRNRRAPNDVRDATAVDLTWSIAPAAFSRTVMGLSSLQAADIIRLKDKQRPASSDLSYAHFMTESHEICAIASPGKIESVLSDHKNGLAYDSVFSRLAFVGVALDE